MQENNTPKTVHNVLPVDLYAVKFTDGYGETDMRFVALVEGTPYLLDGAVSKKARLAQNWFKEKFLQVIGKAPKKNKKPANKQIKDVEGSDLKPINMDAV